MADISVIILTFNEAQHLRRAVESVLPFASQVFVIDSGSNDATIDIAKSLGCRVLTNKWVNHATQFNWAIDNCPIEADWIMRLDADEIVSSALQQEIADGIAVWGDEVVAATVQRRMHFMGRWIAHGGVGERAILRLFRTGKGRCEQRWMDEHIITNDGQVVSLKGALVDDNLQSLTWWTQKHNGYASREAVEILLARRGNQASKDSECVSGQAARVRKVKQGGYYRLPMLYRAILYFLFRYVFLCGFLDGKPGLFFHFLQGCWYRALVDAKVYSVDRVMSEDGLSFEDAVKLHLQVDLKATN